MGDSVQLGPFELADRVGSGGMGTVYRAEHVETGQRVAVKVLLGELARRPDKKRGFRREVQALATLHHPAIAAVLAYGDIDGRAARGAEELVEGAPWFAMEYVDGESMPKATDRWEWASLQSVLWTVLDALSHAHARSIYHRDLKPGNLLLEGADPSEPRPKLVDFGIARLFDPESGEPDEERERVSGTPTYMAPERILGDWRDEGPWTDLYALGCLVWRVVCRSPPYDGETTETILQAHVEKSLPAFEPAMPIPPGLEGWLRGLLQRNIDRRTGCAADAARQLLQLGDVESTGDPELGATPNSSADPRARLQPTLRTMTQTLVETRPTDPSSVHGDASDQRGTLGERSSGGADSPEAGPPPVLSDWRRDREGRTAAVVPGAGLELFALREVPVVDREAERDRMWEALREVGRSGQPALLTLEAEAGAGKSRLARWLCHRALETGAARVVRATHGPSSPPDAGLRGMVHAEFRTRGLSRGETHERILRRLPALEGDDEMRFADARALTELLRPTDDDAESVDGPRYRFSRPGQKYALIRRLFERLARDRPVVAWFDDLQWGREAFGVLEAIFESVEEAPELLAVATVRSDVVAEDDALEDRLEALCDRADASRIALDRLGAADHRALIDRLLHLDGALADAIAERTEGNPLFAVQLLRELVEGNRLESSPDGYELPAGEALELPEDVHDLWLRRLRRLVDALGGDRASIWRALERAAALGREVDRREWRAGCDAVGLERPTRLRDALVERGLAERTDEGWAFTHGLLVDSLERRAREGGRWRGYHRRSAEMLEELYPDRPRETAARRAEHWIAAGAPEEALEPLLEEFRRLGELGDHKSAREVLERRGALLEQLEIPADDPRSIENEIKLDGTDLLLGAPPDELLERLEEARDRAELIGEDRLLARAATRISSIRLRAGDFAVACEAARRATRRARDSGDATTVVQALQRWGWAELVNGNLEAAEKRISESQRRADDQNQRYARLTARRILAWIWMSRERGERATELFERTLEACREAGYRTVEARCHNGLGEIARFDGAADEARRHYRRYARLMREVGESNSLAVSHMNLAQVELLDECFEAARVELAEAERRFEELSQKSGWIHVLRLINLTRVAGTEAWSAFDEQYAPYESGWPEDARLVKDHPWLLEMAGDYAAEAGERARGEDVWRLARELWERLENEEAAARVDEKLRE